MRAASAALTVPIRRSIVERLAPGPATFAEDSDGTVVTLTHTGFGTEEIAGMHEHGWNGTFEQLAKHLGD